MDKKLVKIGRLGKPFGTQGHLRVVTENKYHDILAEQEVWWIKIKGQQVPFFVEDIMDPLYVKFEDIDNPEDAKSIAGKDLYLEDAHLPSGDMRATGVESLIGYGIFQGETSIGTIIDIREFPHQTMVLIDYRGQEKMIPLVEEYILEIDREKRMISMDLPQGLLDI